MKYFVIGLGNPGEKYKNTRHNVAWNILDNISEKFGWSFDKYMNADTSVGENAVFIKPQTFMNRSGEVIPFLKKEYDLKSENLIIVHDDIDLPIGKIKISFDRGDGGHNGVKSIMEHLSSKQFTRIRVGISRKLENGEFVKPNVLGNFESDELAQLENVSDSVEDSLKVISKDGIEKAMNEFNKK